MWSAELLNPIPGANPSGTNLRYSQVYERLRELRREEDGTSQGEWAHEIKKADYAAVVKLATEVLTHQTKDLQIAAWLVDAATRRDGFGALAEGLECVRNLLGIFWDTIYPQLEDGDVEMRVAPLDWLATYLNQAVIRVPLTRSGLNWLQYRESRSIPYEQQCAEQETRLTARNEAIAEGKLPPEEFDRAVTATPRDFYDKAARDISAALTCVQALSDFCDSKFGDFAPSFANLRNSLEDVHSGLQSIAPAEAGPLVQAEEPVSSATQEAQFGVSPVEAFAPPPPIMVSSATNIPTGTLTAEPSSLDDALARLMAITRFLRATMPGSPVPYLLLRAYRWGELCNCVEAFDAALLEPPSSETRLQLKQLEGSGQWFELLEATEIAMAAPCGRGWLDLQRYAVRCCEELGSEYAPVANAITAEVTSLLAKFPDLPERALLDDTPCASIGTQQWLRGLAVVPLGTDLLAPPSAPPSSTSETFARDAIHEAEDAIRVGHPQEALQLLVREIMQQAEGRQRFLCRVQLARFCLEHGFESIAEPVLQELVEESARRALDTWESPQMLAEPLALLLLGMERMERDPELRREIYERLCRLDPVRALIFSQRATSHRAA